MKAPLPRLRTLLSRAAGSRWPGELPALLDPHHVHRVTGMLASALKVGPAVPDSTLHRVLLRAGVLGRDPKSWEDPPVLKRLPWGARRVEAPPPRMPPAVVGPWPQPAHVSPAFYPAVLNTDDADRVEHFKYNAARYLGQTVNLTPAAAVRALRGPRLAPLTDETFVRMFTATSLGQFIRLEVEPDDRAAFGPGLCDETGGRLATIDMSFCPTEHLLPGVYAAPTVTLLERVGVDEFRALAIRVGDAVARPGDGTAWALARYFVLQGAQCRLIGSAHPRLHFGVDAINAITRSALPPGHVVRRLLEPHMRFTLGLHEAVIHHRRSPIHNSQREIYTPFPFTTEGMHAHVAAGRHGVAGRPAYPAYRFSDGLFGEHVPYGRFRRDWFDLMHGFIAEVCASVDRDDAAVRAWAEHIAEWLPGFPSGTEVMREGNLARALASYVCSVSVFHTGDHHSYASLPLEALPFRLRVPPPDPSRPPASLDLDALVASEDFFRHQLSYEMFYRPVILQDLSRVRYRFGEARLRGAAARARRAMGAVDARWQGSSFPSSSRIAASLQY